MTTTEPAPPKRPLSPPPPHQPALDHARKVGAWAVRSLALEEGRRRGSAAMAMHDQVVEHHVAMVTLGEQTIPSQFRSHV